MSNNRPFPQKQSRNQIAQADVVLKKEIRPIQQLSQFDHRRPAGNAIRPGHVLLSMRLRNYVHIVTGFREFFGQDLRNGLNPSDTGRKDVRREKNLHSRIVVTRTGAIAPTIFEAILVQVRPLRRRQTEGRAAF